MRLLPTAALLTALALSTVAAQAAGVTPAQATPVQREQAQSRFTKGKQLFDKKNYEGALTEFKASLDLVGSPNTRLYIGRTLRELGRIVPAYVELGRTEVEAKELSRDDPRYEKAAQSAHDERAQLEPKLGFVDVTVANAEPNTTLKVGGEDVKRGGWHEPIPVTPGNAQVTTETPGRMPVTKNIDVAATEHKSLAIDVADGAPTGGAQVATKEDQTSKPAGQASSLRNFAYVAGGAAVVGVGIFAFFGLKANSTFSDLEDACHGPCPAGHDGQISEGRTQQTIANVGLAVFVVGAAAGVTLWVLSSPKKDATAAKISASPSFVGVSGAFR